MLRIFYIKIIKLFEEKVQEKCENAYLTAKSATASGVLRRPQTPDLQSVVYICKLKQMNK